MDRIEEIRKRVDAVPDGPWFWQKNYECYPGCHVSEDDCGTYEDYERHWALYNAKSKAERRCLDFHLVTLSHSKHDLDGKTPLSKTPMFQFIAATRADVPYLLERVEKLEKELRHLVSLLEPLEQAGTLNVPGLATLNGARKALEPQS